MLRDLINRPTWVKEQYRDDSNLNARIALHKRFSTSNVEWTQWVFDQFASEIYTMSDGAMRIVEIGAGPAGLWVENASRIPNEWHVILSDLSPGMALTARRKLLQAGVEVDVVVAGAEEVAVADASCDIVVANHMIYHIRNRDRAIREFRRVLKPGGVLVAATNGNEHMHELHDLAHRFEPALVANDAIPRQFSLENGVGQLERNFSDVSVVLKENELVVTEVEPLVAYMMSGSPSVISAERREELRAFISGEIEVDGVIRITPITGLLIAKP